MNFTSEIRRDLMRHPPTRKCCRLSMLSAVLETSGDFSREEGKCGFSVTCEDEDVAEFLIGVVETQFGVQMTLTGAVPDPRRGKARLTFSYMGKEAEDILGEISSKNVFSVDSDCCIRAYLEGAFLGGGSCILPRSEARSGYHLEIVFPRRGEADAASELLGRMKIAANVVPRGDTFVVYLKRREAIDDFLVLLGATSSRRTFESVLSEREERNNENRVENCMAGNADRAAIASASQTLAFSELRRSGALETLPLPLREAAEARLKFPTLSLGELAEELGITKSCLNHRFRRLMQIYTERTRS